MQTCSQCRPVRAKAGSAQGPLGPEPTVETGWMGTAPQHPAKSTLKTSITCKQDIRFCQRDQKRLEVFLHSLSLSCRSLSGFIDSFQSEAGRDGSRGDPGLRQGQQQAQGPQRRLPPGPPSEPGLPSTHRVSTPRRAPAPGAQPGPSEFPATKLQAAPSTYFLSKGRLAGRGTVAKLGPLPLSLNDKIGTNSAGRLRGGPEFVNIGNHVSPWCPHFSGCGGAWGLLYPLCGQLSASERTFQTLI